MTTTAIACFVCIVLAASLRAFAPRRAGRRPRGGGLVLDAPVPTLDLVGDRRPSAYRLGGTRAVDPGRGQIRD
jgi:uncharacterized membrane protein